VPFRSFAIRIIAADVVRLVVFLRGAENQVHTNRLSPIAACGLWNVRFSVTGGRAVFLVVIKNMVVDEAHMCCRAAL